MVRCWEAEWRADDIVGGMSQFNFCHLGGVVLPPTSEDPPCERESFSEFDNESLRWLVDGSDDLIEPS